MVHKALNVFSVETKSGDSKAESNSSLLSISNTNTATNTDDGKSKVSHRDDVDGALDEGQESKPAMPDGKPTKH